MSPCAFLPLLSNFKRRVDNLMIDLAKSISCFILKQESCCDNVNEHVEFFWGKKGCMRYSVPQQ